MPWGSRGGTLPGPAGEGYRVWEGEPWWGGTLAGGYPPGGGYPGRGYPGGGTLPEGVPCQGVPWWGYPPRGGYPAGGVPCWGVPCWGGTQLGQHREYLLHGGRYASCVHAGGLSCVWQVFEWLVYKHIRRSLLTPAVPYVQGNIANVPLGDFSC